MQEPQLTGEAQQHLEWLLELIAICLLVKWRRNMTITGNPPIHMRHVPAPQQALRFPLTVPHSCMPRPHEVVPAHPVVLDKVLLQPHHVGVV